MNDQRWLRIIPVAFIMYTISYVDRTNVSLVLPMIQKDLVMDPKMAGFASGIFFIGYLSLQIPGGHLAHRWSAKRLVAMFLVLWGLCAVANGLVHTTGQFLAARFLLGVTESAVFPATLVLLANWFPRAELARANALWMLCQPMSVAISSPISGWILDAWKGSSLSHATGLANWRAMLIIEGILPFIWLPLWLFFISDHPGKAKWLSSEEQDYLQSTLSKETRLVEPTQSETYWKTLLRPQVLVMIAIYFLQNCGAYGCMFWLPTAFKGIKGLNLSNTTIGLLFAAPYVLTGIVMVANARHSDKRQERRSHVAAALVWSGLGLLAGVLLQSVSLWLSYACLCIAVTGPFSMLAPFWAIPTETMPRKVSGAAMGLINAAGNLGGLAGPWLVGFLNERTHNFVYPFGVLSLGLLAGAAIALIWLPGRPLRFSLLRPDQR